MPASGQGIYRCCLKLRADAMEGRSGIPSTSMKHGTALITLCAVLAAFAFAPAVRASSNPLTEHSYAKKGEWEIRWFTDARGAFVYADMIRSYDNSTALRMAWGPGLSAVDFYLPDAATINGGRAEVEWYFGKRDPDFVMNSTAVIHPDHNGDPWLRISQPTDEPGVEDSISNSNSVTVKTGGKIWTFDLKGSNAAYKTFLECFHAKSGGQAGTPAPESSNAAAAAAVERVENSADTPSLRWHVTVAANSIKDYDVPVRKGQRVSVKFLEDSRTGVVDFGKYSVEEGLEAGVEMMADSSKDHRLSIANPTGKPMIFTVFLSRE